MKQQRDTTSFRRDLKRLSKQGKKLKKLLTVVHWLLNRDEPLPSAYRDHLLTGNYVGRRECHIEPDWLLIYRLDGEIVHFERTGSHAELFRK